MKNKYQSFIAKVALDGDILQIYRNNFQGVNDQVKFQEILGEGFIHEMNGFMKDIVAQKETFFHEFYFDEHLFLLTGSLHEDYLILSLSSVMEQTFIDEVVKINAENFDLIKKLHDGTKVDEGEALSNDIEVLKAQLKDAQKKIDSINRELASKNELLTHLALHDNVTHLLNRQGLQERFPDIMAIMKRLEDNISMILLDIKGFRKVNDQSGHDAGDKLLKDFADVLLDETRRDVDFVFRLGNNEFLLILVDSNEEKAKHTYDNIEKRLSELSDVVNLKRGIITVNFDEDVSLDYCLSKVDKQLNNE